jgi:type VI secretion system Hcp family effector
MRKSLAFLVGLSLTLAAGQAFAAIDAYLTLDGIKGESTDKDHLGWIEDFSFDVEQTLNIGSQSSGAGAGKVTFNPFSITRKIDSASPSLFQMAQTHKPIPHLTFELTSEGTHTVVWRIVATNAVLTSYRALPAAAGAPPREQLTFVPGTFEVWSRPFVAGGPPGAWVHRDLKDVRGQLPHTR